MLKKLILTTLLLVVLCTTATTYAQVSQAPDGIQFQALATDANGHPAAGRVIYVKDAIVAKTATGTIVYSETFKVTASSAGIFTIVLGKGTYASGVTSIANIDWANGPFFLNLKIAVEPTVPTASWNVNNEYVDLGTSQFWSVPYALYAGNVKGADTKLNIADTAAMLKPYFTSINLKANIESPTFTGTVSGITKAMVGLGNVDNTADANKPVSTATQAALDVKANATDVNTALALKANATDVTTALALKANAADVTTALDLKVDKVSGKALSTNDYTTAEKTKLAAITGTNTGDQDLSALAIAADVNAALALKANAASVANSINTINNALNTKANASDVTAALALKANTADVNSALATKTNASDVAAQLVNKEDKSNKSLNVSTDAALDTKYPSVKAVKTYVDLQIAGATIADASATVKGKIQLTGDLAGTAEAPTVPGLTLKLDANQKGVANGVASLNAQGIIPSNQLPPVTLSSTNVVGSDAAMQALSNATVGSIAIRTDLNKNYVLSALPASNLVNWVELLTPAAPVQAVNGYTGSVSLTKSDLGLSDIDNTSDINKPISAATQTALNLKANSTDVNTALATKISTADVTAALAVKANSADVNTALATKMSTVDATAALALKANNTDVNTALATKISTADATAALVLKLDANKVGIANGVASLDGSGKVPTDQIPAISFSSVKVLASEAEMLALNSAVIGSVVIRTDESKNYVLAQANPAVRANWIQLLTPAAPVQSVNGRIGTVSINAADLGLGNVQNTSDANKPVSSATQIELDKKVDKVTGKSLSTNDYTTAEKTKLAAITGTNTGDQDLSAYATTAGLALKANIASPTFTGVVTTNAISTGALSSTSVTTPVYASTPINLSYTGTNLNWNTSLGLNASITLTQNSALNFTSLPVSGSNGTLVITQDATGGRTLTLPTTTNRILGSTSTTSVPLSTNPGSRDILNFYYDGTAFYWNIGQGYGQNMIPATTNLQLGVSGTLQVSNGGTGATAINGLVKGNGTSAMTNAVAGVDYVTPTGSAAGFTNFPTLNQNTTGNAATATLATNATYATSAGTATASTKLSTARNINGVPFDGTADITIASSVSAGTLSGTTLASNVVTSSLTSVGTLANLTVTNPITGSITGNAGTSSSTTKLATARNINGVPFDGTADITIASSVSAGTLTGTTLASNVVTSSLTGVGTITTGTWSGTTIAVANGGTGANTPAAAKTNLGLGNVENTALTTWTGSSNITTVGSLNAAGKAFWFQDLILGYGTTFGTISTDGSKHISFYPRYGVESTRMWPSGNVTIQNGGAFVDNGYSLEVQGNTIAKSYKMTVPTTIAAAGSSTTTVDLSTGNMFKISLGANVSTLALSSVLPGTYILEFIQDATGGRTVTFPAAWRWSGGTVPTITSTANKIDIVTVIYDGSTYFASIVQNF